jgi:hypothetical protein
MTLLAIDPGSSRSAWVAVDELDVELPIVGHGIDPNDHLLEELYRTGIFYGAATIEWMSPRGMPTSAQEFETLYWVGRFSEALLSRDVPVDRITRLKIKVHVCGSARANDTNIRAALIDRYGGSGGKAQAIGLKANPGPLYGLGADEWAALALAVTWADQKG